MRWILSLVVAAAVMLALATPASAGRVETCRSTTVDELKQRNIGCRTARQLYRVSLRRCPPENMNGARCVPFRFARVTWRCRAINTSIYTWRCTARSRRLMQYRWVGGD